jgi:hypothetical protein
LQFVSRIHSKHGTEGLFIPILHKQTMSALGNPLFRRASGNRNKKNKKKQPPDVRKANPAP